MRCLPPQEASCTTDGVKSAEVPTNVKEVVARFDPSKVEGQVVKVDMNEGKVTVRTADGTIHEFQTSKETLQDLKVGDRIAAQLRNAPNC